MGKVSEGVSAPLLGGDPRPRSLYGAGARAFEQLSRLSAAGAEGRAADHGVDDQQLRPQPLYAKAPQEEVLPRAHRVSRHDLHAQAEPYDTHSRAAYTQRDPR